MKFSHALQLNAVPDWLDEYLAYSNLKKLIYLIEKAMLGLAPLPTSHRVVDREAAAAQVALQQPQSQLQSPLPQHQDRRTRYGSALTTSTADTSTTAETGEHQEDERQPLLRNHEAGGQDRDLEGEIRPSTASFRTLQAEANALFTSALDEQLLKIVSFYSRKERELLSEVESIVTEVSFIESYEEALLLGTGPAAAADSSAGTPGAQSPASPAVGGSSSSTVAPGRRRPRRAQSESLHVGDMQRAAADFQPQQSLTTLTRASPFSPEQISSWVWSQKAQKGNRNKYRKRCTELYLTLCELRSYVDLNFTGFNKILKKYEKVTGNRLKRIYMSTKVEPAYPFRTETKDNLQYNIDRVVAIYARILTDNKVTLALTELNSQLREHIVYERNTIWRDMIEKERRSNAVGLRPSNVPGGGMGLSSAVGAGPGAKARSARGRAISIVHFKLFGTSVPVPLIHRSIVMMGLAITLLVGLANSNIFSSPEQNGCFAILVFASILWAFELIPLFVTSMLIPFLVVIFRVLREPASATPSPPSSGHFVSSPPPIVYNRLDAKSTAKRIFSEMFSPVIMLLLGGFSLAAALSKHHIAKEMASFVLAKAGTSPPRVLLAFMFVSTFSSMWISNVAAPVLCFSLMAPILRNLPHRSPYAKTLILGTAMAANVGGMASPIASPQNIIAINSMNPPPSWPEWFAVSLPLCITVDLIVWGILLLIFNPSKSAGVVGVRRGGGAVGRGAAGGVITPIAPPELYPTQVHESPSEERVHQFPTSAPGSPVTPASNPHPSGGSVGISVGSIDGSVATPAPKNRLSRTQIFILLVTFVTIILWCVAQPLAHIFGDMGVIAIIPIVAFFGTGVLTKEDFNNFLWTVIMLAMGGISLGKAVESSGLLEAVVDWLVPFLGGGGATGGGSHGDVVIGGWWILVIFTAVVLVVTTFISHTVGALILLPVVARVGLALPNPMPRTLVMATALMCSGAMGLPISSFPNMNAISLEDPTGVPWLSVSDFLRVGLMSSLIAWLGVVSIAYGMMGMLSFG
ncbi:low-affinity phosphate transporter [Quaeritorhiza haematococci]|nr:low-affinity phosphate transporter [Quaeritorhiza haematococci]